LTEDTVDIPVKYIALVAMIIVVIVIIFSGIVPMQFTILTGNAYGLTYEGSMYSFIAGQTFTTESDTAKISSITVGLRHWQIPTANQVTLKVWNSPQRSALYGANTIYHSEPLSASWSWFEFKFDTPIPVSPNTQYYFEFQSTSEQAWDFAYRPDYYGGGVGYIYLAYNRAIYKADGDITFDIQFIPYAGSLAITSTPTGAGIYVDDVYVGVTPATITDLSVGSHIIKLTLSGYQDHIETINVTADQTTTVDIQLTLEITPPPPVQPVWQQIIDWIWDWISNIFTWA